MAKVLVTGGAGYVGGHVAHALLRRGIDVCIADDLSRGYRHNVPADRLRVGSLLDKGFLEGLFTEHRFDAVMHFAAFAYVGESSQNPELYFWNNVAGSIALLDAMSKAGVQRLVFSSTCAVYGEPEIVPIAETSPFAPLSPYGESKVMVEKILDWMGRCRGFRSIRLRYFNACGADPEGAMGEEHDPETHLIPLLLRAAVTGTPITIFGDDYPTPDGTCIRDYIHVTDLADAHIRALSALLDGAGSDVFNIGTGSGYSVKQVLAAAESVTGRKVPYTIGPRRPGDAPSLVADGGKVRAALGWSPRYTDIRDIVSSAWDFERRHHGM